MAGDGLVVVAVDQDPIPLPAVAQFKTDQRLQHVSVDTDRHQQDIWLSD